LPGRDIIVIGASAGGVQALLELVRGLPADMPAAVFVVVHTSPASPGVLPQILQRAGTLTASQATDGLPVRHGHIYVAPPDHHLLVLDGHVKIARGPKENGFRPAADPLFRTAARTCGARTVGIVLSGGLDDGTEGLAMIKRSGGVAIAQDPIEALFSSMPASAIANVDVDHVLPVAQMPPLLIQLATEPVPEESLAMQRNNGKQRQEGPDVAEVGDASLVTKDLPGPPSGFTCPECGGALWELRSGKLFKFRCHVGHSYTAEGLISEQTRDLESALWTALRSLEENAALRRRMAKRARTSKFSVIAEDYDKQAVDAEARASLIRGVLMAEEPTAMGGSSDTPRPEWDGKLYGSKQAQERRKGGEVAAMEGGLKRGRGGTRRSRSKSTPESGNGRRKGSAGAKGASKRGSAQAPVTR
jgi:two-component system chemotaxis response regulator CheB